MNNLYKLFILAGAILIITGIALLLLQKLHIHLGRLPGDVIVSKERFSFYFPIATCIILSVLLSIIFYFFGKFK